MIKIADFILFPCLLLMLNKTLELVELVIYIN